MGRALSSGEVRQFRRTTPALYDHGHAKQPRQAAAVLGRAHVLHPDAQHCPTGARATLPLVCCRIEPYLIKSDAASRRRWRARRRALRWDARPARARRRGRGSADQARSCGTLAGTARSRLPRPGIVQLAITVSIDGPGRPTGPPATTWLPFAVDDGQAVQLLRCLAAVPLLPSW